MMRFQFLLMVVLIPILTLNCGSHDIVGGGTGTETTNARVISSAGKPVPNANVLVINSDAWYPNFKSGKSVIVDTIHTDSQGRFQIDSTFPATFNLQIESLEEIRFVSNAQLLFTGESTIIDLQKTSSYSGQIVGYSNLKGTISLKGTAWQTDFNTNEEGGLFKIPVCAPGMYNVIVKFIKDSVATVISADSVIIVENSAITNDTVDIEPVPMLLENFSRNYSDTVFCSRTNGYWYSGTIEGNITEFTIGQNKPLWDGLNLHSTMVLRGDTTTSATPAAWTVLNLADTNRPFDFSRAQSFDFMARGKGKVFITFITYQIEHVLKSDSHFGIPITLNENWTKYHIPISELVVSKKDGLVDYVSWLDVSNGLTGIGFGFEWPHVQLGDTTELWIDDISVNGVEMKELLE